MEMNPCACLYSAGRVLSIAILIHITIDHGVYVGWGAGGGAGGEGQCTNAHIRAVCYVGPFCR